MQFDKPLIALAPMAGMTDKTMRALSTEYGTDYCVTEMISAKAIYYKDKKTYALAAIEDRERPCGIQIFGYESEIMAYGASQMLQYEPEYIDINMGCPVGKIVSNGEGSALMKDPLLAASIVTAVKKACQSTPVSVKIRSGFDKQNINAVSFAKAMCDAGADMICVHGRTREQMYSGKADRKIIAAVKAAVPVPVLANGDIFAPEDAVSMLSETGADGVMVARGALGNPFIFRQIKELIATGRYTIASKSDYIMLAQRHLNMLVSDKGEYGGVREARKHLSLYIKGMPGSAEARGKINSVDTLAEVVDILQGLLSM